MTRTRLFLLSLACAANLQAAEFGAFYTKIESGEPFEQFSRTGPHADIVVRGIGEEGGRLVFWRGSSYLPYYENGNGKWFLDELYERSGDGPRERPDKVNTYSVARIIESSPERAVIHWRYLPRFEGDNPHFNMANLPFHWDPESEPEPTHLVDTTAFVDEYFTIIPDGTVTRKVKRGTEKFDDWIDPRNQSIQELRLSPNGIKAKSTASPAISPRAVPVVGSPLRSGVVGNPVKWWRFDEGVGDHTLEAVAGDRCVIGGHRSYWKKGVSGRALAFDGYTSVVGLPSQRAPSITDSLTLEGWIALGAYPWNWTPIVQQGHEESYYLGIGPHGHVRLAVKVGDKVLRVDSATALQRKRWYHVAGTYDGADGKMRVYIDGECCGEVEGVRGALSQSQAPVQIGKGKRMAQSNPVRKNTFEGSFSFDGLIDEVRIHAEALSSEQIALSSRGLKLTEAERANPDLDERVLPAGEKTGRFGAYYTQLKFYDTWDGMFRFGDHPDVVVEFDKHPTSFVFWRGVCYIAMIVNEAGQWWSNEFNETWNRSGGRGCQEPMSDKESFSNHVKILENTPARCVVLWRYPLVDVLHTIANYDKETGWGDWSDWIYTIYPDGVAAKQMICWTDGSSSHEWHEGMVITGPDQHPEQVVETDPALVLVTLDGEVREYSWKDGPPRDVDYRDAKIHLVNFKAEYDPFTIGDIQSGDVYGGEVTEYSVFPSWNHWPVAQMPSDGRYAQFPDRTAHSSLTHIRAPIESYLDRDRPFQRMLLLEGMTQQRPKDLIPLAKSWLHAPSIEAVSGCEVFGYDQATRAYPLVAVEDSLTVRIAASQAHPIVNLCFEVRNWGAGGDASLHVEGASAEDFRQGTVISTDGTQTMVIWVETEATAPITVTIRGAQPRPDYTLPVVLMELQNPPPTSTRSRRRSVPLPPRPKSPVAEHGPVLAWDAMQLFDGQSAFEITQIEKLQAAKAMTWSAWFRTESNGTILSMTGDGPEWVPGGGTLFVRDGQLVFDIGWVGQVGGPSDINDGSWHHVAVVLMKEGLHFYLDGEYQNSHSLSGIGAEAPLTRFKIGYTNEDFPDSGSFFYGDIRKVAAFDYPMTDAQVKALAAVKP